MFNTISVIGLGYIGLPTAALFASRKVKVIGVDISRNAVNTINRGEIHIIEPELDALVSRVVQDGYLRAVMEPERADAFLIAVPTPFKDGREPDLSYIQAAANSIAPKLEKGNLVILESTSPVGTTEQLASWLASARPDLSFPQHAGELADIHVGYCPERVLPGKVVEELVSNSRIIGGMTVRANELAIELYKTFVQGDCITTDARTAELTKLTENSYRDVNIAFANELSLICDHLDIDVWELVDLANLHPRVNVLQPGAGVGGHCIAVDPWFIVSSAPDYAKIIKLAREINSDKPKWVIEKIKVALTDALSSDSDRSLEDISVACLGLAFKPNIDDLRESPALQVLREVTQIGCKVIAVEPNIKKLPLSHEFNSVVLMNLTEAVQQADILCVLVKHKEFEDLKNKSFGKLVINIAGLR